MNDLIRVCPAEQALKGNNAKILLGLCKGKKLYDKRAVAAKRDADRDIARAIKEQNH